MTPANLYTAPDTSVLNLANLSDGKLDKEDCRMDADLDPNLSLIIAGDANQLINWLVVGQVKDGKLRILKSFFTKYDRKLGECAEDVAEYYRWHKTKKIIFYFDHTFKGQGYGNSSGVSFYQLVTNVFRRNQWVARQVYIGQAWEHRLKGDLINRMFKGKANLQVLINRDNNPDLLISIQSAGVFNGNKDKRGEKLVETEEDKLESRTDGSDAFDTVCIGVERFPVYFGQSGIVNTYG